VSHELNRIFRQRLIHQAHDDVADQSEENIRDRSGEGDNNHCPRRALRIPVWQGNIGTPASYPRASNREVEGAGRDGVPGFVSRDRENHQDGSDDCSDDHAFLTEEHSCTERFELLVDVPLGFVEQKQGEQQCPDADVEGDSDVDGNTPTHHVIDDLLKQHFDWPP